MSDTSKIIWQGLVIATILIGGSLLFIYTHCDGRCAHKEVIWSKHCQDMCFKRGYCPMED